MALNALGSFGAYFRRPPVVLRLALLAALVSAAIVVLLAVGSAQVLLGAGSSKTLPLVYLLLSAASLPLASAISTALRRWPVVHIGKSVALASVLLTVALRLAIALELPGVSLATCVAAYLLDIVLDTLFWLSAAELLPTGELKRNTPFLAASFGLGGCAAGIASAAFCEMLPGEDLLFLGACFFSLSAVQYRRILRLNPAVDACDADAAEPGVLKSLKAATGVIRTFPIAAAISASVLLMSVLFCLQDYLAMTAFQQAFPDADELASFLARIYASQQAIELLVLLGCGGLILERAGPVARNLIFPATTCLGLLALHALSDLSAAVLVHVNAVALSNAVFEPVKTLNYAALPHRVVAQVRMLIDGIVYPLGLATSGLSLLWLQSRAGPEVVLEVAIATAAGFAAVSALVGAWFLPNLLRSLRLRAISPSEYVRTGEGRALSASDIRQMLNHPEVEARRFGLQLAIDLAPDLLSAESISESCQEATSSGPSGRPSWSVLDECTVRLRDEDYAAVGVRPPTSARGSRPPRGGMRSRRADANIWRFALITRTPSPERIEALAQGLDSGSAAVRQATARILARFGAAAVPTAAKYLRSNRPEVIDAAIRSLGGTGTRRAEELLRDHLAPLYRQAQLNLEALSALQRLAGPQEGPHAALEAWLIESNRGIMRRALLVKAALGNPRDIKLLNSLMRTDEPRTRSGAVEALVNLPTRRFIQPLVPLLEARADRARAPSLDGTRTELDHCGVLALRKATAGSTWGRLLATRVIEREGNCGRPEGDEAMLDLVLFLKSTPLFRAVPLEDIARAAQLAEPISRAKGETIADADEPVLHVYVVREGSVELRLNDMAVEVAGPGACIGEDAVFGEERHAVGSRAAALSLLLRFPVSIIADLVAENPDVLGCLALDLSSRLHRLRARLAAQPL